MTRRVIEITCQNTIAKARQLESCADSIQRLANTNLARIKNDILAAWQGNEANAYVEKIELTSENILTTANKLRNIAATLRKVTEIFRDTELRALEIAERRTYNQ